MNLVKWNPFRELEDVSNRLNTLFGRLPVEPGQLTLTDWQPVVDISETDHAYLIKAEIPDVEKRDVKVSVHDDMLTLSGERRQEKEDRNQKFYRIERAYGRFSRSFRLPPDVEGSTVSAEFKNGMPNVTLPKSRQAESRSIDISIA